MVWYFEQRVHRLFSNRPARTGRKVRSAANETHLSISKKTKYGFDGCCTTMSRAETLKNLGFALIAVNSLSDQTVFGSGGISAVLASIDSLLLLLLLLLLRGFRYQPNDVIEKSGSETTTVPLSEGKLWEKNRLSGEEKMFEKDVDDSESKFAVTNSNTIRKVAKDPSKMGRLTIHDGGWRGHGLAGCQRGEGARCKCRL